MKILAGDIGGTKTVLGLFEADSRTKLALTREQKYVSADFDSLESLIKSFLKDSDDPIQSACFGIPGPVINDISRTTNLPWVVDEARLGLTFGINQVHLINDLEATGHGVLALPTDQLLVLNEGKPVEHGNMAIIAAGTGLGQAAMVWEGQRYRVIASEGGHADFAPRSEIEIDLLNYLLKRHKRVSYERVLSGPGLMNVYSFLKDCRYETEPDWLAAKLETGDDKAKVISDAALAGDDAAIAVRTLDLFVSVYGAQAGNLALTFNATGGVFLGGGIAPKISAKLLDGTFMKSYVNKGRLSPLVEAAPVKIVMKPKTALLGAARYAAEHAHE